VGNEDKHRNQAGITKLRVPRFSTALSFAVPMAAGRHRLLFAIQMQRAQVKRAQVRNTQSLKGSHPPGLSVDQFWKFERLA